MNPPRTPLNVGIVGLGFMASTHLKALAKIPEARVHSLCNPSGRHLDGDFSKVEGNIGDSNPLRLDMRSLSTHRDVAAFLNDPDLDVVDICAPTRTHPELVRLALQAGKHVLCEKPLARTTAQCDEILEWAKPASQFVMPAMCLRFWPEYAWLKARKESGEWGRLRDARFRRVAQPPGWGHLNYFDGVKSGGALLDLHIHDVDFIQDLCGPPTSVFARGYSKHSGAIDHVVAVYDTQDGAVVHAEGSWAMTGGFGFNMAYTANFERATVDYDLSRGDNALKVFVENDVPQILRLGGEDGYVGELRYFLNCIRENRTPQRVTLIQGRNAVAICEAEERSIRSGHSEIPLLR